MDDVLKGIDPILFHASLQAAMAQVCKEEVHRQQVLPQQPARARPAPQPVRRREVATPGGLALLGCAAAAVLVAAGVCIMRRLSGGSGRGKKRPPPPRQPTHTERRWVAWRVTTAINPKSRSLERRWNKVHS
jgi:negative regulator of sigma E activity